VNAEALTVAAAIRVQRRAVAFILNDLLKRGGLLEVVDYSRRLDVQEDEFLSGGCILKYLYLFD
jgi:hypothetical protein